MQALAKYQNNPNTVICGFYLSPESLADNRNMPNISVPIAIQRKAEVLEMLASGHLVRDIAEHLGCVRESISRALANDPEYQAAMAESFTARLEQRESELESAEDHVSLTRADRLLNHQRWLCERRLPNLYGQRPTTAVQVNGEGSQVRIVSWRDQDEPGGG